MENRMMMEDGITRVSSTEYALLVMRAHESDMLKKWISQKVKDYQGATLDELRMLNLLYCEEDEADGNAL